MSRFESSLFDERKWEGEIVWESEVEWESEVPDVSRLHESSCVFRDWEKIEGKIPFATENVSSCLTRRGIRRKAACIAHWATRRRNRCKVLVRRTLRHLVTRAFDEVLAYQIAFTNTIWAGYNKIQCLSPCWLDDCWHSPRHRE